MENINNQPSSHSQKHPQGVPARNINEYAERHRLAYDALNNKILELQGELSRASEERMDPKKSKGSPETYTKIISSLKAEIAKTEAERDNLHTQKTIH